MGIKNKLGCYRSIGVLDSGVGGITVLSELMQKLPQENFIYLKDESGMPYGCKSSAEILSRTVDNCKTLLECGVKAIVVACNTATNVGIAELRKKDGFLDKTIYVGLEPAVKPAFETVKDGKVLVLVTPATSRQEKFAALISVYDKSRLIISPQPELAGLIEDNISDLSVIKSNIFDILSKYTDVKGVVLGCTHYIFVKSIVREYYGGNIEIFDGNAGAANRLKDLLARSGKLCRGKDIGTVRFITT